MKTCPSAKLAAPPLPPLFDKPGAAPAWKLNMFNFLATLLHNASNMEISKFLIMSN